MTEKVQNIYAEETKVLLTVAKAADIRVTGNFSEKADEIPGKL